MSDGARALTTTEVDADGVREQRAEMPTLLLDNTDAFAEAMNADFGTRSRPASPLTEVVGVMPVIEHTRSHVAQWMKPARSMRAARLLGLRATVEPTPLGVATAAFAAGNRVMIKMSEITSRTAELIQRLALTYAGPQDVIDYLNERPAPLAAYWYGLDGADFGTFVRNTPSGGVARNNVAVQIIPSATPYGRGGQSRMGAYRGKAGFDAFSHYRTGAGSDLPFSPTETAARPFGKPVKMSADVQLRLARNRVHRRLGGKSGVKS